MGLFPRRDDLGVLGALFGAVVAIHLDTEDKPFGDGHEDDHVIETHALHVDHVDAQNLVIHLQKVVLRHHAALRDARHKDTRPSIQAVALPDVEAQSLTWLLDDLHRLHVSIHHSSPGIFAAWCFLLGWSAALSGFLGGLVSWWVVGWVGCQMGELGDGRIVGWVLVYWFSWGWFFIRWLFGFPLEQILEFFKCRSLFSNTTLDVAKVVVAVVIAVIAFFVVVDFVAVFAVVVTRECW